MEKNIWDISLETQTEYQNTQEKLWEKMREYLQKISPKNQDFGNYYTSIFWETFNEKNLKQLLSLFSHIYIKYHWYSLVKYLQNIWSATSFSARKEMYASFKNDKYMWSATQNMELYHFLVQQVELKKIAWNIQTQIWTQESLLDLKSEIKIEEQWELLPETQDDSAQLKIELEMGKHKKRQTPLLNPKTIKSGPYRLSSRWVTMCSFTARKNLEKLWVTDFLQWDARELTQGLKKSWAPTFTGFDELKNHLFTKAKEGNVFDLYPETPNGHRAIAFLWKDQNGDPDLFVLDPYYSQKSVLPITLEDYMERNASIFSWIVVNQNVYKITSETYT